MTFQLPSIVITGAGKSGTTALYYCVKHSAEDHFGINFPGVFEPRRIEQVSRLQGDYGIVKVLLERLVEGIDGAFGSQFNKRLMIFRDPRDNVISRLVWEFAARLQEFSEVDVKATEAMFLQKQADPESVSVLSLFRQVAKVRGRPNLAEASRTLAYSPLRFLEAGTDFTPVTYDGFVDWAPSQIESMEDYLGFPLKPDFEVAAKALRVKRTASHGYFPNWFLDEDYEFFCDPAKLTRMGFDPTRRATGPKAIAAEEVSGYLSALRDAAAGEAAGQATARTATGAPGGGKPRAKSRPVCLLVAGMHRSGTSAAARTISLLGANLPKEVLGPSANNPLGHWEPKRIYELQNELLAGIDSTWDDWTAIAPEWFESGVADAYVEQIAEYVAAEFERRSLFVLKDPRVCRLIPLWRRAMDAAGVDLKVVITLRNPMEVASSLQVRNQMAHSKALLLWLRHVLEAERTTRDLRRAFVPYPDLLSDWRGQMRHVAQRLQLVWPRWTQKAEIEIDTFLSPDHRHHVMPQLAAASGPGVPKWVSTAYDALQTLVENDPDDTAFELLDGTLESFDTASRVFWRVMFDELAGAHERAERQRFELKQERHEAQTRAQRLTETLLEKESRLLELNTQIGGLEQSAKKAEELVAATRAEAEATAERLKASILKSDHAREAQSVKLQNVQQSLEVTRQSLLKSDQAREAQSARVQLFQDRLEGAKQAIEEYRGHTEALRQKVVAAESKRSQMAAQVGEIRSRLLEERAASERQLQTLTVELEQMSATVRQHNERVSELEARNQALSQERSELGQLVAAREEALQVVSAQLTAAEKRDGQKGRLVDELRADVQAAHEQLVRLRAEQAELTAREKGLSQALDRLSEEHAGLQKASAQTVERLQAKLARTRNLVVDARHMVLGTQAKVRRRTSETRRLARFNEQLQSRMAVLETAVSEASRQPAWQAASGVGRALDLINATADAERRQARAELLKAGLFDAPWYLASHPEARLSMLDPMEHFLTHGEKDGAQPHPLFDPAWYAHANGGSGPPGRSAILHFLRDGGQRGASPHILFDSAWYLAAYPDVARGGANPLVHYLQHGAAEGRNPHPDFDTRGYLTGNPDVAAAGLNPLVHYVRYGLAEGRAASKRLNQPALEKLLATPLFDGEWYARTNRSVSDSGADPALHYLLWGARHGLAPHPWFDPVWYLKANPKVGKAWASDPLIHFLDKGWKKGYSPHPLFDPAYYAQTNPIVTEQALNPLVHFLTKGWRLGRSPHPKLDIADFIEAEVERWEGDDPLERLAAWGARALKAAH
jgi:hypothetical protein